MTYLHQVCATDSWHHPTADSLFIIPMTISSFTFLFRTPGGKEPVSAELLQHPLFLSAEEKHPLLTMADYFTSLQQLVTTHEAALAPANLSAADSAPRHCIITSEKLGAFYHVAKVEIGAGDKSSAFAVNTAISGEGRNLLEREHHLLGGLPSALREFVPEIFFYIRPEDGGKKQDPFSHMAVQWLEGFHEWHLCGKDSTTPEFTLWTDNGAQQLKGNESRVLFSRIAHIITLSYDWHGNAFLQRWHHAAGDFIVRRNDSTLDVRLITVRAIEPFPFLEGHELQVKFSSLLLFLIDLSIRMRLDKLDGVGKTVWLDNFVVEETVRGFLSGLAEISGSMGEAYATFIQLLPHFSANDLRQLSTPLVVTYQELLSATDLAEVQKHLAAHFEYLTVCLTAQVPG